MDAARILLPQVQERLISALGPAYRILIGLPERNLLIAASLTEDEIERLGREDS